jgi:hypothetical protein
MDFRHGLGPRCRCRPGGEGISRGREIGGARVCVARGE